MPSIGYVKAMTKRLEQQSQAFARCLRYENTHPSVTIISKYGCAACVELGTALEKEGVMFREISVDYDEEAKQLFQRLPRDATILFPVTLIGNEVVIGNNSRAVLAAYSHHEKHTKTQVSH